LKKDSPFAFIVATILTLALSFLIFVIVFKSIDVATWVGVGIGEILLWLNAWVISKRKKKWPYRAETNQQRKTQ
jgi:hypothetical protein